MYVSFVSYSSFSANFVKNVAIKYALYSHGKHKESTDGKIGFYCPCCVIRAMRQDKSR